MVRSVTRRGERGKRRNGGDGFRHTLSIGEGSQTIINFYPPSYPPSYPPQDRNSLCNHTSCCAKYAGRYAGRYAAKRRYQTNKAVFCFRRILQKQLSRALPKPKNGLLDHQLLDANTDDFSEPLKSSVNLGVNGIADSIKRKTPEARISEVSLEHSV